MMLAWLVGVVTLVATPGHGRGRSLCALKENLKAKHTTFGHVLRPDDDDDGLVGRACKDIFEAWGRCLNEKDKNMVNDVASTDNAMDEDSMCALLNVKAITCTDTLDDADDGCAKQWYAVFNCYFSVKCGSPVRCVDASPTTLVDTDFDLSTCVDTCDLAGDGLCNSPGLCECGTDCDDCGPEVCPVNVSPMAGPVDRNILIALVLIASFLTAATATYAVFRRRTLVCGEPSIKDRHRATASSSSTDPKLLSS